MQWLLKTRLFARWMRKSLITDALLLAAVDEMERGLVDADLGGGVFKKRIALPGRGKSGGARTIVATNRGDRWIFLFGFEKNDMDNISTKELESLRENAKDLLELPGIKLQKLVDDEKLQEIRHEPTH